MIHTTAKDTSLDRFAALMGRIVPDAITACVILLLLLVGLAVLLGNAPMKVWEAYYQGLWMLLPFTMQMTLIILLSTALGSTPFFRKLIVTLSQLPKTTNQVVILSILITGGAAYVYWGLGIALGPIITVYFARDAERRGVPVDFLYLFAINWGANATWQYGLSASAPLLIATPGHFLEKTIGVIPLSKTIFTPAAILQEVIFVAVIMVLGCVLMPKNPRPISQFPGTKKLTELVGGSDEGTFSWSQRVERHSLAARILCLFLAGWLAYHFVIRGLGLDINSLNTTLLLATILLHANFKRFTEALHAASTSAWPVIVLYHLYAGVAGLIQFTTVGEKMAGIVATVSTPMTFPFFTAVISTVFAMFIPSSGGQWAIQGFVTAKAAMAVGVSVPRGILAMGVGDHMGNLASPFWYVILGGIANVDFRSFFGYGLIFAAAWFCVGVVVFTFAPC